MAEQEIGWYEALQQNDWFKAAKDVSDAVGEMYEENKFGFADQVTGQTLTAIEREQQANVETADISQTQMPVAGNPTTNYLLIGVAGLVGVGILALALKG